MPAFSLCSRSPDGAATTVVTTYSCSLLLIYRPRQDERLSWPSWLTYYNSGQFTHISGHPSTVGRAQDSESSPVKDQRCTAEPRNQPWRYLVSFARNSYLFVENREFCIPHLYLAPTKGWPRWNFVKLFDAHNTRMIELPCDEETMTLLLSRTDGRT